MTVTSIPETLIDPRLIYLIHVPTLTRLAGFDNDKPIHVPWPGAVGVLTAHVVVGILANSYTLRLLPGGYWSADVFEVMLERSSTTSFEQMTECVRDLLVPAGIVQRVNVCPRDSSFRFLIERSPTCSESWEQHELRGLGLAYAIRYALAFTKPNPLYMKRLLGFVL